MTRILGHCAVRVRQSLDHYHLCILARREFITFSVCNHFREPSFDYSLILVFSGRLWCERLGLNQWPHDYQSCALPTELRSQIPIVGLLPSHMPLCSGVRYYPHLTDTLLLNGRAVRTPFSGGCIYLLGLRSPHQPAQSVGSWQFVLSFFSLRTHKLTSDLRRVSGRSDSNWQGFHFLPARTVSLPFRALPMLFTTILYNT